MKIARPKTERYHNFAEGDCGNPIDRKGIHLCFFKKGDWKRVGRKKFFRNLFKTLDKIEQ
jgi:hypothetical protein